MRLENVCLTMSMGVYHTHCLVCSHLSMTYTFIRPDKYNKYGPVINSTIGSSNCLLYKGPMIWNAISTSIQQSHSLKCVTLSITSIVVRGYEDLAKSSFHYEAHVADLTINHINIENLFTCVN